MWSNSNEPFRQSYVWGRKRSLWVELEDFPEKLEIDLGASVNGSWIWAGMWWRRICFTYRSPKFASRPTVWLYIQSFSILIKLFFIFEAGHQCLYISLSMLLHIYFTCSSFLSLFQHSFLLEIKLSFSVSYGSHLFWVTILWQILADVPVLT